MRRSSSAATTLVTVVLSSWLAGAHFLRFFALELVLLCLLLPLVLLVRRAWAVRIMQGALVLSFFMWLRTAADLAAERQDAGEPWTRMLLILLAVAAFALVAALSLEGRWARERYGLRTRDFFH